MAPMRSFRRVAPWVAVAALTATFIGGTIFSFTEEVYGRIGSGF